MIRRITTRAQLIDLAKELKVRPDWHEPDEQDVTATTHGTSFDTAGFWPAETVKIADVEQYVTLYKEGEPVANVNLALLFAWATGYNND